MRDPRNIGNGVQPKYEVGDEVKIWKVLKHPIGSIQGIVNPGQFPTKYRVQYTYYDGSVFTETFESEDLTLHRRWDSKFNHDCECGGVYSHSYWCPRYNGR